MNSHTVYSRLAALLLAFAAFVNPATSQTISQQAYLKASNTGANDSFGISAVAGDTIAIGAPGEASNATGVNGNQGDNSAAGSGAVYVFVRSGTNWVQQAYLKASNTGANDGFGRSVAISGDTIVVGALGEASNAPGVNGDQSDDSTPGAGAAYVFVRNGTTWTQQAYLKASNPDANDFFGVAVSASGDTVVVGAYQEDSNATGVDGDQSDNSALAAGAAYVFVRNGTNWSQQAYLKASNAEALDGFGLAVGISGDTIAVSSTGEANKATGVNGNQSDNTAPRAGAVYVFVRTGTNWGQQAYLKASNTGAGDTEVANGGGLYPGTLALWGDTVVVGAVGEASNATGVNGNQASNSSSGSGAAYVFTGLGKVPPRLTLVHSGATLQLSWPTNATGFVLQSATTLANGGGWQNSSLTPATVGDQNVVSVETTNTASFFHLHKP